MDAGAVVQTIRESLLLAAQAGSPLGLGGRLLRPESAGRSVARA